MNTNRLVVLHDQEEQRVVVFLSAELLVLQAHLPIGPSLLRKRKVPVVAAPNHDVAFAVELSAEEALLAEIQQARSTAISTSARWTFARRFSVMSCRWALKHD